MLVDTHCHIHEPSYSLDGDEVLARARSAEVEKLICVGTNELSSRQAVEFAAGRDGVFASIGVHPHDTKEGWGEIGEIAKTVLSASPLPPPLLRDGFAPGLKSSSDVALDLGLQISRSNGGGAARQREADISPALLGIVKSVSEPISAKRSGITASGSLAEKSALAKYGEAAGEQNKLIAIGEIGLDYFYAHSPREIQIKALEEQLDIAEKYHLPVIFHVREAFDDFWPIFDNFRGLRGVLHSFTDTEKNMEQGIKRGLYIGVNGISTFTKDQLQQQMFARIPLEKMLLETDAPFLTPAPFRGTINEPVYIRRIAEYHAEGRGLSFDEVAAATTDNAAALFNI